MSKELLSRSEVAKRYSVTERTIHNWLQQGIFPQAIRIGRIFRWSLSELQAFEENSKKGGE